MSFPINFREHASTCMGFMSSPINLREHAFIYVVDLDFSPQSTSMRLGPFLGVFLLRPPQSTSERIDPCLCVSFTWLLDTLEVSMCWLSSGEHGC